jgi:16S rRNA processing protein RimM
LIPLGKIVRTRGNRGEVIFSPFPRVDDTILKKGDSLLLTSEKYRKNYEVDHAREINGALVVKFTGINTINEALKLVGYSVFKTTNPGEQAGVNRIIGFTVQDATGRVWGKISAVENHHLNKTLEIQADREMFYVPFVDSIVTGIDEQKKLVIINPPDGLRELNR